MPVQILTVTLNPAVDRVVLKKRSGRESVLLSAGGKGVNVSRALKVLGSKSCATGLAGGAAGDFIQEALDKENIRNDFVSVKDETRTNLTVLGPVRGRISRVMEKGPRIRREELMRFKRKFNALLKGCRYAIFSGSPALGLPKSIYADLIILAGKKRVKSILDTSGPALAEGLKAKPFLVKPNIEEAETLLGKKLNSLPKIKEAIEYFHSRGVEAVIVTMGPDGAVGSYRGRFLRAIGPRVKAINNVGCGDAFLAGFMLCFSRKGDFPESLRWAAASGAANALSLRPGAINRDIILKLLGKVKIKQV